MNPFFVILNEQYRSKCGACDNSSLRHYATNRKVAPSGSPLSKTLVLNLGYPKTSFGVCKIEKEIVLNTEQLGPDLGLATGDPDVRTFNLEAPFLS
jgi:hypothetical protein